MQNPVDSESEKTKVENEASDEEPKKKTLAEDYEHKYNIFKKKQTKQKKVFKLKTNF